MNETNTNVLEQAVVAEADGINELRELGELQLAMVGGGIADVIAG